MKKSEVVLLSLMAGVVVAANMERQPNTVRNVYKSRNDCVHDYSDTQCREETSGVRSSTGGRWVGPDYRDDERARKSDRASGKEPVKRGGFGFSGRSSSSS